MTGTIPRRARYFTFAGLATLALAVVAQVGTNGSVVAADTYTVPLHQSPPIQNSGFTQGRGESCPESPPLWGWHFILTGNDATFVSLTTTFQTAGTIVTTDFGPPTDKHAYVYTRTDDTLLSATATVTGGDPEDVKLVLSHTCPGTTESPETPSPTPTTAPPTTVPPTTVPPTTVPPTTNPPTETVPPTTNPPTETVPPTTNPPTETVPPTTNPPTETVPPTTNPPTTVPPTTESPTVAPTTVPPTTDVPSPTVSGVRSTTPPPPLTIQPSVGGVKQTRAPQVGGNQGALPDTGNKLPIGLLLLLGFGLVGAGVVTTIAGEPAAATSTSGRHRR